MTTDHQLHSRVCPCLNDSAECCRPNCLCHTDQERRAAGAGRSNTGKKLDATLTRRRRGYRSTAAYRRNVAIEKAMRRRK